MKSFYKNILLIGLVGFCVQFIATQNLFAQEIRKPIKITEEEKSDFQTRFGSALSSRYMWRGLNLSKSPVFEPYTNFLFHGLELSFYGVFGLSESEAKHPDFVKNPNPDGVDPSALEKIAFAQVITNLFYNIETGIGTFTLGVTDYYFSDRLIKQTETDENGNITIRYTRSLWDNWEDKGNGAHTLEGSFRYTGNESFPLWILFGYNFYNDPDNSIFAEVGYTFRVAKNNLSFFAGGVLDASEWYQFTVKNGVVQKGVGLTNFGFVLNRELQLEEWLSLDFSVLDVMNFYEERNTILFKMALKIR